MAPRGRFNGIGLFICGCRVSSDVLHCSSVGQVLDGGQLVVGEFISSTNYTLYAFPGRGVYRGSSVTKAMDLLNMLGRLFYFIVDVSP